MYKIPFHNYCQLRAVRSQQLDNPTPYEIYFKEILTKALSGKYTYEHQRIFWDNKKNKGYVIDFFIPSAQFAIEIDGSHHLQEPQLSKDKEKDKFLRRIKVSILRIQNKDLSNDTKFISSLIKKINAKILKLRMTKRIAYESKEILPSYNQDVVDYILNGGTIKTIKEYDYRFEKNTLMHKKSRRRNSP